MAKICFIPNLFKTSNFENVLAAKRFHVNDIELNTYNSERMATVLSLQYGEITILWFLFCFYNLHNSISTTKNFVFSWFFCIRKFNRHVYGMTVISCFFYVQTHKTNNNSKCWRESNVCRYVFDFTEIAHGHKLHGLNINRTLLKNLNCFFYQS